MSALIVYSGSIFLLHKIHTTYPFTHLIEILFLYMIYMNLLCIIMGIFYVSMLL